MRVLSLSHRLPHSNVDNHNIFNAPSLFDYDVIVLDAGAVFETIRAAANAHGEYMTHADLPVVNGESVDGAAGMAELLQRRREEFAQALERGVTVVVYAAAQNRFGGVQGLQGLDRYFYLPAPDGVAWDATMIRGGEGTQAVVVDHGHPFVPVFETYERYVLYRAYFNERAPGFSRYAKVFLRSAGGAPVGVEFPVLGGRVIFMPTPRLSEDDAFAFAEANATMVAAQDPRGIPSTDLPYWATQVTVPGLADQQAAVEAAKTHADEAQSALEEAEAAARSRAAIRDVLWAGGTVQLTAAAAACLEAIGFEATVTPEGDTVLTDGPDGERSVHLVAAASEEAVGMAPHYRLRQRLDAILASSAVAARGLVVANGQRLGHPDERQREIEDSLRVASEATRYAVILAPVLFAAARAALEGAPADTLRRIRDRLAQSDGVVTLDDLVPSMNVNADEPATA